MYDWVGPGPNDWAATPAERRKFVWSGWLMLLELDEVFGQDAVLRKHTWGLDLAGLSGAGVAPANGRWSAGPSRDRQGAGFAGATGLGGPALHGDAGDGAPALQGAGRHGRLVRHGGRVGRCGDQLAVASGVSGLLAMQAPGAGPAGGDALRAGVGGGGAAIRGGCVRRFGTD